MQLRSNLNKKNSKENFEARTPVARASAASKIKARQYENHLLIEWHKERERKKNMSRNDNSQLKTGTKSG